MGRSFRDLRAWQEAILLARGVDAVADAQPPRRFKLADQLSSAARSVHACIAEGAGKSTRRDFRRFLEMSRGSLNELESDFVPLSGIALVPAPEHAAICRRITNTGRLLDALIESTNR